MAKLKNLVFGLVAFAALLVTPAALAPATSATAVEETSIAMDYSAPTYSSVGGAPLK